MMPDDEDGMYDHGMYNDQGDGDAVEEAEEGESPGTPLPLTDAALAYTFSECEIHGLYMGESCPRCTA